MISRSATWVLLAGMVAVAAGAGDARGHGQIHRTPTTRADSTARAADADNPISDAAGHRVGRLNQQARALKEFAEAVVTDLNDRVKDVGLAARDLQRQQTLHQRNMRSGFGMRRWSAGKFDKMRAEVEAEVEAIECEYLELLPVVTVGEDGEGPSLEGGPLECLAGREDVLVLKVAAVRTASELTVSARVAGTPVQSPLKITPTRGTSFHLVRYRVDRPGRFELTLSVSSARGSANLTLSGRAGPSHRLKIRIVDAATGKPCAARAYVKGSDGRYFIAGDRPVVLAGAQPVYKFGYADGVVDAVLPPGNVEIKIRKGFEYNIESRKLELRDDKTVSVKLTRWVDMPAVGWYSGDTHVHWVRHTWYENGDPAWLNIHSRAEDLWVNNNLILKHWWKNVKSPEHPQGLVANRPDMFGVGKVDHLSINGHIVWTAEEYRNDEIFGHMVFLRISHLIEPVSTGFMGGPDAVHYPPNSYVYDDVHQAGGIAIAAHDVGKEVPIQIILDKLDSLDAHNTHWYYHVLNCGFRMPVSIGSDYPANLMGFARVYVHCGKKLEYDKWVDNLSAGKTFVSSGAMIFFEADGKQIGDTIELEPGQKRQITVKGTAMCNAPLRMVEIVHNGAVVKRIKPADPSTRIEFNEKIDIEGPGWLAARTYAGRDSSWWGRYGCAHTSPIYIKSGQERLISRRSVERLLWILRAARDEAGKSEMYASDKQKAEVVAYFGKGIAMYEELLSQAK